MERKRITFRNKLWIAKEEVKELERLLLEAKERLDDEYAKSGGRSWWEKFWYFLGYTI